MITSGYFFFFQAVEGSIIHGAMLSSGQIQEEIEISTLSGHSMKLYKSESGTVYINSIGVEFLCC